MKTGAFGIASRLAVGQVAAHCPNCKGELFFRALRQRRENADALVCAGCGAEHLRTALLSQITEKIIQRADEALRKAKSILGR